MLGFSVLKYFLDSRQSFGLRKRRSISIRFYLLSVYGSASATALLLFCLFCLFCLFLLSIASRI